MFFSTQFRNCSRHIISKTLNIKAQGTVIGLDCDVFKTRIRILFADNVPRIPS